MVEPIYRTHASVQDTPILQLGLYLLTEVFGVGFVHSYDRPRVNDFDRRCRLIQTKSHQPVTRTERMPSDNPVNGGREPISSGPSRAGRAHHVDRTQQRPVPSSGSVPRASWPNLILRLFSQP